MNQRILRVSILCTLFASFSGQLMAKMDGNDLVSFCSKKDVMINQRVEIKSGRTVMLVQGSMMTIETEAPTPTKQLIASELARIHMHSDCIEYLMDKGISDESIGRVYFDFDKFSLTPASLIVLEGLMEKINRVDSNILLSGHTDSIGTTEYNYSLGLKRAESVQGYLINEGVDRTAMILETHGEDAPISDNVSKKGREKNRRVEISAMPIYE
ncbi:OmpA family protein [Vibrio agarivorans]|uniref:OmpA family protein n=1 Tax=Vibrio agarivorans TaxID=153622 RepID=A0ABT7Y6V8_9VIBR|nr:OmpA family protein [Vibrio agarivorans]MDN2483721.1 OmpA family protein [Vibrio agarivorans]